MPLMNHNLPQEPTMIPSRQAPTINFNTPASGGYIATMGGLSAINSPYGCPCCGRATDYGLEQTSIVKMKQPVPGADPATGRIDDTKRNIRVCRTCGYSPDLPADGTDNQTAYVWQARQEKIDLLLGTFEQYAAELPENGSEDQDDDQIDAGEQDNYADGSPKVPARNKGGRPPKAKPATI